MTAESDRIIDRAVKVEPVGAKTRAAQRKRQETIVLARIDQLENAATKSDSLYNLIPQVYEDLIPADLTEKKLTAKINSLRGAAIIRIDGFVTKIIRLEGGYSDPKTESILNEIKSRYPGLTNEEIKKRLQKRNASQGQKTRELKQTILTPTHEREAKLERVALTRPTLGVSVDSVHKFLDYPPPRPTHRAPEKKPTITHKPLNQITFKQSPLERVSREPDFDDAQFLVLATVIEKLNRPLNSAGIEKLGLKLNLYNIRILIDQGRSLIAEHPELRSYYDAQPAVYLSLDYFIAHRDDFKRVNDHKYSALGRNLIERLNLLNTQQLRELQVEAGIKPLR
jgi:hypothetical protein